MAASQQGTSLWRQTAGLILWLGLAYATAAVGAVASVGASAFYTQLTRPGWAPPAWLFGPVWTALYALMGIAAWLVWRARGFAGARRPLLLFIAQLLANALWSWLFFAWRQGALAFFEVLFLWCLIAATALLFWRVSRVAAVLLLPYLGWVTFASALTLAIWRLNPTMLR
jgi:tryptophan-rich sensory protein